MSKRVLAKDTITGLKQYQTDEKKKFKQENCTLQKENDSLWEENKKLSKTLRKLLKNFDKSVKNHRLQTNRIAKKFKRKNKKIQSLTKIINGGINTDERPILIESSRLKRDVIIKFYENIIKNLKESVEMDKAVMQKAITFYKRGGLQKEIDYWRNKIENIKKNNAQNDAHLRGRIEFYKNIIDELRREYQKKCGKSYKKSLMDRRRKKQKSFQRFNFPKQGNQ